MSALQTKASLSHGTALPDSGEDTGHGAASGLPGEGRSRAAVLTVSFLPKEAQSLVAVLVPLQQAGVVARHCSRFQRITSAWLSDSSC